MNALTVTGLSKRYPSFALKDVSFQLPRGSITGFIGVNGAGKSTTLKSIMGYVHPDAGELTLFGAPFTGEDPLQRRQIGFVAGGVDFYLNERCSAIARATRRFYPQWDDGAYQSCLKRFRLDEVKRVRELSAGMKVKFQLALALSSGARLLLLDEPTSGLDPVSRDDLLELLRNLCEEDGVTVLFSTHITSDLEKCAQHVIYIQQGEILFSTEKKRLLEDFRLVKATAEEVPETLRAYLIGAKVHFDEVVGLVRAGDAHRFPAHLLAPASLEDIMVYMERRAAV